MGGTNLPAVAKTPPAAPAGNTPPANATTMGATVACAICRTNNSSLETYCGECGFLLASTPGQLASAGLNDAQVYELVEQSSGRRFRLKPGANTIGRENCDVLLMDGSVSRRHAQLTLENGLAMLMDTGSSNGTLMNETRLGPNQPAPVANGAVLKFGSVIMTLIAPNAPAKAEPARAAIPAAPEAEAVKPKALLGGASAAPSTSGGSRAPASSSSKGGAIAQLKPLAAGVDPIFITPGTIGIGRRTGNDIVITDDAYISGRHAELLGDETGCYLTDVGSTNGTLVNGRRLEPHQKQLLLDGDEVKIGQNSYTFETLETPA